MIEELLGQIERDKAAFREELEGSLNNMIPKGIMELLEKEHKVAPKADSMPMPDAAWDDPEEIQTTDIDVNELAKTFLFIDFIFPLSKLFCFVLNECFSSDVLEKLEYMVKKDGRVCSPENAYNILKQQSKNQLHIILQLSEDMLLIERYLATNQKENFINVLTNNFSANKKLLSICQILIDIDTLLTINTEIVNNEGNLSQETIDAIYKEVSLPISKRIVNTIIPGASENPDATFLESLAFVTTEYWELRSVMRQWQKEFFFKTLHNAADSQYAWVPLFISSAGNIGNINEMLEDMRSITGDDWKKNEWVIHMINTNYPSSQSLNSEHKKQKTCLNTAEFDITEDKFIDLLNNEIWPFIKYDIGALTYTYDTKIKGKASEEEGLTNTDLLKAIKGLGAACIYYAAFQEGMVLPYSAKGVTNSIERIFKGFVTRNTLKDYYQKVFDRYELIFSRSCMLGKHEYGLRKIHNTDRGSVNNSNNDNKLTNSINPDISIENIDLVQAIGSKYNILKNNRKEIETIITKLCEKLEELIPKKKPNETR